MNDPIERQAAKEAYCKKFCHPGVLCPDSGFCREVDEAFDPVPSAQPEPLVKESRTLVKDLVKDTISRQAAVDELKRISFSHWFECGEYLSEDTREIKIISSSKALEVIEALPPAQPAPQNDSDRIYAMMKDYYFEHKDEHDVSWQGGFGKCMNLIPNVIEKKAQPEPQWIPVSEGLPEDGTDCLVSIRCQAKVVVVDMATYSTDLFKVDNEDFFGNRGESGWYCFNGEYGYCKVLNVIAWMPLPEPYAEGRTDE